MLGWDGDVGGLGTAATANVDGGGGGSGGGGRSRHRWVLKLIHSCEEGLTEIRCRASSSTGHHAGLEHVVSVMVLMISSHHFPPHWGSATGHYQGIQLCDRECVATGTGISRVIQNHLEAEVWQDCIVCVHHVMWDPEVIPTTIVVDNIVRVSVVLVLMTMVVVTAQAATAAIAQALGAEGMVRQLMGELDLPRLGCRLEQLGRRVGGVRRNDHDR